MNDQKARAEAFARQSEVEKVVAELQHMREAGEWDREALDRLSPETRVLFEVMIIEALTTWPPAAQRRLRVTLIVHGYDEQCARRVMSDNLPDSIRASLLYSMLRPCGDTGPLVLPNGVR
ncbi:MAG TPA: hypothetical protein VJZ91_03725 [Blastocatellia bacterium]|nr:hypothetical protein [Blastocatellia bacterium]